MAAGGVDVARRRDDHYSKKESHHLRNSYRDTGLNRGTEHSIRYRNGYVSYAGTIKTGNGRDGGGRGRGFVGRSGDWELGELSGGGRGNDAFASESRAVDNEISKFEDRVSMPPEKRRKFSPIVWDRDDKEVRISSRNRIIPRSTPPCYAPESVEKLANDCTEDGDVAMVPTTNAYPLASVYVAAGSVPLANSPSVLAPEKCGRSNRELGMVEEDEYIEVRHVATSRWAHEEDSPCRSCSDNAGDTPTGTRGPCLMDSMDTPESGEFCGGFEGSRGKSSSSVGQGSFEEPSIWGDYSKRELGNDDFMAIDEMHDEAADVNNLESDLEDYEDFSKFPESAAPKHRSKNMLQGCRSIFEYEKLRKINEGTYGVVYKARDKKTDEIMALKKVKMGIERDGFPLSSLREINILLSLHHPSVVEVKEVVMDHNCGDVFMVMEYMEHDLKGLVDVMKQPFSEKEVKCLMLQLLEGVKYLHDNWVLHRDLKTSNLLVNNSSKLKICDFGLSRQYGSPLKPYTPLVVTLWYRAPELLLGTKQYSTAIDMWSVGCIMAELLAKQPLFNGKTEFEQLDKIIRVLGTPSEAIWPGFSELPGAKVKLVKQSRNTLREKFPAISFKGSPVLSDQGFDFLSQLLTYNPDKRITAEAAVRHRWFHMDSEQELISIQESLAKRLKLMTKV